MAITVIWIVIFQLSPYILQQTKFKVQTIPSLNLVVLNSIALSYKYGTYLKILIARRGIEGNGGLCIDISEHLRFIHYQIFIQLPSIP